MNVTLRYPCPPDEYPDGIVDEKIAAIPAGDGLAELRGHAYFMPLGPGDIVRIDDDGGVLGVVHLALIRTYQVHFPLPEQIQFGVTPPPCDPTRRVVAAVLKRWEAATVVTQSSNYTARVSSVSLSWLEQEVVNNPLVEYCELVRDEDLALNFAVAVRNPNLDGRNAGPWA